jgi:UDP-N-acetylglucosamine 2-epimerase (non-hydrolysing)
MAPVILRLQRDPDAFETVVMATAQHRQMLDQVLEVFRIEPDIDMDIMRQNQTLTQVTCGVLERISAWLVDNEPDVVLAQGDTTTVMASAMACFYNKVPFGHVEAGLRTGDLFAPYPEEFNRRVATVVTDYHFAPTSSSAENLTREGTSQDDVYVVGNTVVDALFHVLNGTDPPPKPVPEDVPYILMTCHRREVFGSKIREIFETVRDLARERPDIYFWYPTHPNPSVREPAHSILGREANVVLTEPLDYVSFVHAMSDARVILSDSGGVQEEAPSLGKPVLVLRDTTERPEGVAAGTCRLVGPNRDRIREGLESLLDDPAEYAAMSRATNPYGDGRSADRIARILSSCPWEPWAP